MPTLTKNQIVIVTDKDNTFQGRIITAGLATPYLGQFIVISLEAPIGPKMTRCFRVNGSSKSFGISQPVAV